MAKVSIEHLACWRSGEIITEKKLNEVFALVGKVINLHHDEYMRLIAELNQLHLASRWIAQVDNFAGIQLFIDAHKNNENFQPPNKPLPSSGDVFFVNNNSDDPNLPPYINPGRYLYIYLNNGDGTGQWEIYNPWALANASKFNDGLMSKEDWLKLHELPNRQELDWSLSNFQTELEVQQKIITNLSLIANQNKEDLKNLKPRVSSLELLKQDKRTKKENGNLPGYRTETVEDNLVEVKRLVDDVLKQKILIWEPTEADNGTLTFNGGEATATITLNSLDTTKLVNDTFIKVYVHLSGSNLNTNLVATLQIKTSTTTTYTGSLQIQNQNYHYTLSLNIDTKTVSITFQNTLPSSTYNFQVVKIIKDIGVSDYMWVEIIEHRLQDFLNKNIGIKKELIVKNTHNTGFNGFEVNEEYNLGFKFIKQSNCLELYAGGTKLTKGVEWEEVEIGDDFFSNRIKFLKQIDIAKVGSIEAVGLSMVVTNLKLKVWNNQDTYAQSELVLYQNSIWFAKQANINQEPNLKSKYWGLLNFNIDIEALKQQILNYINQKIEEVVDLKIEQAQKGIFAFYIKGERTSFKNQNVANDVKRYMITKNCYYLNERNEKVYYTSDSSMYEVIPSNNNDYVVEWKETIYTNVLADIKVVQGTPDEVAQLVEAALAKYWETTTLMYDELIYEAKDEAALDAWLKQVKKTRDDIEIIPDSNSNTNSEIIFESMGDHPTTPTRVVKLTDGSQTMVLSGHYGTKMMGIKHPDFSMSVADTKIVEYEYIFSKSMSSLSFKFNNTFVNQLNKYLTNGKYTLIRCMLSSYVNNNYNVGSGVKNIYRFKDITDELCKSFGTSKIYTVDNGQVTLRLDWDGEVFNNSTSSLEMSPITRNLSSSINYNIKVRLIFVFM